MSGNLRSSVGTLRIATIVVGVIIIGVGLHSHFQSAWTKSLIKFVGIGEIKVYQVCEVWKNDKKCPHISLERFFVATILICFVVSLVGLILYLLVDMGNRCLRFIDTAYHIVAALFLLAAAAAYIVSAEQINNIVDLLDGSKFNFRRPEKLAAGALTIFQGVLYGVTAIVVARS